MIYMYLVSWMKCPTFNVDSTLRLRLVCFYHQKAFESRKNVDTCPCLYGLDEETLKLIISKEIDRGDIIEVEKRKWFEKQLGHKAFELKEERKEESINFLKKLPYSEDLWGDIEKHGK